MYSFLLLLSSKEMLAVFKYVKGSSDTQEVSFSVFTGDKTVSVGFKLQQRRFRLDIKKKHCGWLTVQIGIACWSCREAVETSPLEVS